MKKKLFALLAALLCLAMLFVGCRSTPTPEGEGEQNTPQEPDLPSLDDILNVNWTAPSFYLNSKKDFGKADAILKSNSGLSILTAFPVEAPNDIDQRTLNVYSHYTNSTVATFKNEKAVVNDKVTYVRYYPTVYTNDLAASGAFFIMLKVEHSMPASSGASYDRYLWEDSMFERIEYSEDARFEITVYDATGAKISSIEHDRICEAVKNNDLFSFVIDNVRVMHNKLLVVENELFMLNDNGTFALKKTFELTSVPQITSVLGDYFYSTSWLSSEGRLTIYDQNLDIVLDYELPDYAVPKAPQLLNNGNIIVQAFTDLPEDTTDFDRYNQSITKQDLTTYLFSVESKTVTEIAADYEILSIARASQIPSAFGKYYADEVENVATIRYIPDNKLYDASRNVTDTVSLSNEGAILESLRYDPNWESIPQATGNGFFLVKTLSGQFEVLDASGKVQCVFDLGAVRTHNQNFIVTAFAIYNLKGAKLYDLRTNHASVVAIFEDTIILKTAAQDEFAGDSYYLLKVDGTTALLGTMGGAAATIKNFGYSTAYGIYYLEGMENSIYGYYNNKGEALGSFTGRLDILYDVVDGLILADSQGNAYKFCMNAIPPVSISAY